MHLIFMIAAKHTSDIQEEKNGVHRIQPRLLINNDKKL